MRLQPQQPGQAWSSSLTPSPHVRPPCYFCAGFGTAAVCPFNFCRCWIRNLPKVFTVRLQFFGRDILG